MCAGTQQEVTSVSQKKTLMLILYVPRIEQKVMITHPIKPHLQNYDVCFQALKS